VPSVRRTGIDRAVRPEVTLEGLNAILASSRNNIATYAFYEAAAMGEPDRDCEFAT